MESVVSSKRGQGVQSSESVVKREIQMSPEQITALGHLKVVYPEYQDPNGLIGRIIQVVAYLKENQLGESACFMPVSATRDRAIFITTREFQVVQKAAGKGAQSTAYFTVSIPLDGGNPKNQLIKRSKKAFKPEVERLKRLSPASKLSGNIDHFMGTYSMLRMSQSGLELAGYVAMFNASSCDLCHIDYGRVSCRAKFITRQLVNIAEGIASFYRADIVLRDIKGANLLCNWEGPGKVTDFGLVQPLAPEGKKHSTTLTPKYAAPFIWESILGQKYRAIEGKRSCEGGYQGKAADIFALGRTLQLDVLNLILRQLGSAYRIPVAHFVDHLLIPEKHSGKYSDQELLAFERMHPGKVFHIGVDQNGRDHLNIFKDARVVYGYTSQAIELFKSPLSDDEYQMLVELASLAMELQNPSKEGLLAYLGVEEENVADCLISVVRDRLERIRDIHTPLPFPLFVQKRKGAMSPDNASSSALVDLSNPSDSNAVLHDTRRPRKRVKNDLTPTQIVLENADY